MTIQVENRDGDLKKIKGESKEEVSHVKAQGAETWAQTKDIEIENGDKKTDCKQGYPDQPDSIKPNSENTSAAVCRHANCISVR